MDLAPLAGWFYGGWRQIGLQMCVGSGSGGPLVYKLDWRQFKLTGAGELRFLERDLVLSLVRSCGTFLVGPNLSLTFA